MTKREEDLKKLLDLPESEVRAAIKQVTLHVKARLRFGSLNDRTKSGAHGEKNLGMNAIDYYVGESVKRLYDPNGWNWNYERFSLGQQLCRIANKLISDVVDKYKETKELVPTVLDQDVSEVQIVTEIPERSNIEQELVYQTLIEYSHKASQDDDDLFYFTLRYFEKADYVRIAQEMGVSPEQIYVLRKKLVRKLMPFKEEIASKMNL